jgi:hypothetical protein
MENTFINFCALSTAKGMGLKMYESSFKTAIFNVTEKLLRRKLTDADKQ